MKAINVLQKLLAVAVIAVLTGPVAYAGEFDINTANFFWTYDGTKPVTEFHVDCATVKGGPYTMHKIIADPTARQWPVKDVVGAATGNFFCVAQALNNTLSGGPSPEYFFLGGVSSGTITSFGVK